MGWTLSPKTTPPAAWMLMATGYAGRPCSGAGPNGTIRTARASGVLWPDHSPARRLPRPRGVTPMTHPRLDSDEPAAAGPTAAAPARPATGTRPWTQLGWSHKDGHQRRRTRFTANWCHVGLRQTRIPSRAPAALGPCLPEFGSPDHSGQPGPTRAGVDQVLHRLRNG